MGYSSGIVGELGEANPARRPNQSNQREYQLRDKGAPDWSAIGQDYLAGTQTIAVICERHNISRSALSQARNRLGWPGRYARRPIKRVELIGRLFGVLERQISNMENRAMDETAIDKEVALLGTLSRTLEKLVELDAKARPPAPKTLNTDRDMAALRQKITTRISQLEKS